MAASLKKLVCLQPHNMVGYLNSLARNKGAQCEAINVM